MTPDGDLTAAELLTRAVAAERTAFVLKQKVRDLYNGGSSVLQRGAERARAREAEMRRRQELAVVRNAELARYNAQLENEVAARTRDVRIILDNVTFGFLIVGRDGTIRDGATRSCSTLLGREVLAGVPFADAFAFSPSRHSTFVMLLDQIFDDVLPEDVALAQLPRRSTSPNGRSLDAEGRAVRTPDGAIEGVLFTITDVTALEAAERESAHYRLLVQILRQREAFDTFVVDFRMLIEQARAALGAADQSTVRRVVHTIKGNSACFGLSAIVELAHRIEDNASIDGSALDALICELDGFLSSNADVLQTAEQATLRISSEDLRQLEQARLGGPDAVQAWIARMRCQPVRILLCPIEALVPRLAERFGKQVDLVIEGGDIRVDVDILRPIVRELGHVVRNAVCHGIEPPERRIGKAPTGTVTLRVAEDRASYQLEVTDDGSGIDAARVGARAREMGVCSERELAGKSRDGLLSLVFIEGLSTAENSDDVSGRGVGMSAIRAAVESAGGTIRIDSELGRGTRVEISVPRRRF